MKMCDSVLTFSRIFVPSDTMPSPHYFRRAHSLSPDEQSKEVCSTKSLGN